MTNQTIKLALVVSLGMLASIKRDLALTDAEALNWSLAAFAFCGWGLTLTVAELAAWARHRLKRYASQRRHRREFDATYRVGPADAGSVHRGVES